MTCKETPDSGSSAGIESHDYDGVSKRYLTSYTYKCPFGKFCLIYVTSLKLRNILGKAFDVEYLKEVNNTCDYQDAAQLMVYWTYNETNKLPNCIRKYIMIINRFLDMFLL